MREIKFRGYDIIGKKWVYGDLVHNQKVTADGLEPRTMVGGYEVDPESVGINTGVLDKKGNEIYVGDKIRIYYRYEDEYTESEVVFERCVIGIRCDFDRITSVSFFAHFYKAKQTEDDEYEIEIIGKVYHEEN